MSPRAPGGWALLVAGLLGCLRGGWAFSNGSVASSCDTLLPGHGPYSPSVQTPPYIVTASASTYRPGGSITVTIETASSTSIPFQGFLLQARSRVGQGPERWPVGCFTNINSSIISTLDCGGLQKSSISHSSKTLKQRVQVTWEAPNNNNHGDVYFCASFVQTYSTFWVKVNSAVLKLEESSSDRTPTGSLNPFFLAGLAGILWSIMSP